MKNQNWMDKVGLTIALILLASQLSQFTVGSVTAKSSLEEYCKGAPECYPVDENGNILNELEFGDMLRKSIQDDPAHKKPISLKGTFFTSYNPEIGQTDGRPCVGAGMTNICELSKKGIRVIALSQDLVGRAEWKMFRYGEQVRLISDSPECNGIFQIEDTMNPRYKNRGDMFQLTRSTNTSCWARVMKL